MIDLELTIIITIIILSDAENFANKFKISFCIYKPNSNNHIQYSWYFQSTQKIFFYSFEINILFREV